MKILIRIFVVLTILAAGGSIYFGTQLKAKKLALEADIESKKNEISTLTTNLAKEKKDHEATKGNLNTTKKNLEATTADLEQKKKDLQAQMDKTKEVEGKLASITGELAAKKAEMEKVLSALPPGLTADQIAPKIKEFQDTLTTMEQEKKVLNEQLAKMEVETRRLNDMLERRKVGKLLPGTSGHVLSVNDEWNFVVLDVGSKQGVVDTATMIIYRDGNLVGKVKVTQVEPTICIADILPEWKQDRILEGDMVAD